MNSYLTSIKEFTDRSPFTERQAAELESKRPGWLMQNAASISAEIDVRLGKGYVRPIPNPPEIVKKWAAYLLTVEAFEALGVRPSDEIQERIDLRASATLAALKECADSKDGLYDLPRSDTDSSSGRTLPQTLAQSEHSPFSWRHKQYDAVRGNRRYG